MRKRLEVVFSSIEEEYLDAILQGKKKYELRIAKDKFLSLKRGGFLVLFSTVSDLGVILRIEGAIGPEPLDKIFSRINFKEILPMASSLQEAERIVWKIYGDPRGKLFLALKIKEFGVFSSYNVIEYLKKVRLL